jgi:hypothetical protein
MPSKRNSLFGVARDIKAILKSKEWNRESFHEKPEDIAHVRFSLYLFLPLSYGVACKGMWSHLKRPKKKERNCRVLSIIPFLPISYTTRKVKKKGVFRQ